MSERKLILPAELKVCATCTYWDGVRTVDQEVGVVVVGERCRGECLVREDVVPALHAVARDPDCLWDNLEGDEAPPEDDPAGKSDG
jgi:hypothetical protein